MNRIIVTILVLLAGHPGTAQYTYSGKVVDDQRHPLAGVTVSSTSGRVSSLTDSLGVFRIIFPDRPAAVSFSHAGFESLIIRPAAEDMGEVMLQVTGILLMEAVVQSFEKNRSLIKVPAAVSVINASTVERFGSVSMVPAVNTVPGVKMDERSPGSYRLSIRGNLQRSTFGVRNVKFYWNGIPFTDAGGTTYFNEVSPLMTGKMEILKGPSGSMYGSGTGGVVLLGSNLPLVKGKDIMLQFAGGSFGLFSANAVYSQSDGSSASRLTFAHQQSDGYRKQTGMRRDALNFTGTLVNSSRHKLNANVLFSDLYYQVPGALTRAEQEKDPRQARPAAGVFRGAEAQQAAIFLRTLYAGVGSEYVFNSKWKNSTSVYISGTNFRNPTIRNYELKTEHGAGLRTVTTNNGRVLTIIFGAEYQYGFINTATYGNKLGAQDTLQYHDEISAAQFNAFVQADLNLPANFILNGGISYNRFQYGFYRLGGFTSAKGQSWFRPQFVPRVSLLKKITGRMNVYVAVSKGYSPPTIDEIHAGDGRFNNSLEAETALNAEVGLKGDIVPRKLTIDVSCYWFRLGNTIVSRRDAGGGDYFINAGNTKQQGSEIALQYLPVSNSSGFVRNLKLWTSYTGIHARFRDYIQGNVKYDGNRLPGTASGVFNFGADLSTAAGIQANITYNYTSRIPLNDANTFYADNYHLLFTRLAYQHRTGSHSHAVFYIVYDRSFNNPYSLGNDLNAAGNRYYNPSSPQNITAGMKLNFSL